MRVAVERERKAQLPRLPEQRRKQRRITPLAQDHVRVVDAQQALETHRYRALRHHPAPATRRRFPLPARPAGHAAGPLGNAFQPHPHDAQRRQLIVDRPFVIATLDGANFAWQHLGAKRSTAVAPAEGRGFSPAAEVSSFSLPSRASTSPWPAGTRLSPSNTAGKHQVGVVEPQAGIIAMHQPHQGRKLRGVEDVHLEHAQFACHPRYWSSPSTHSSRQRAPASVRASEARRGSGPCT